MNNDTALAITGLIFIGLGWYWLATVACILALVVGLNEVIGE